MLTNRPWSVHSAVPLCGHPCYFVCLHNSSFPSPTPLKDTVSKGYIYVFSSNFFFSFSFFTPFITSRWKWNRFSPCSRRRVSPLLFSPLATYLPAMPYFWPRSKGRFPSYTPFPSPAPGPSRPPLVTSLDISPLSLFPLQFPLSPPPLSSFPLFLPRSKCRDGRRWRERKRKRQEGRTRGEEERENR